MGVMGMQQRGAPASGADDGRERTRIEAGAPDGRHHRHRVGTEAGGQLGAQPRYHRLGHLAAALQLARELPDLPLPATPLAAGGDMDHRSAHEGGSVSMAMLPLSRRMATGPPPPRASLLMGTAPR